MSKRVKVNGLAEGAAGRAFAYVGRAVAINSDKYGELIIIAPNTEQASEIFESITGFEADPTIMKDVAMLSLSDIQVEK